MAYRDAVKASFGPYARFGIMVKDFQAMDKEPQKWCEKRVILGPMQKRDIGTSYVERNNLTSRTFIRRLTRRTLAFSKKLEHFEAAVALHVSYYNWAWKLRGFNNLTPAMVSGMTNKLIQPRELFESISN